MKILSRLLGAYRKRGFSLRTGLNPYYFNDPDAPFTELRKDGKPMGTGRGLAPLEVLFLERLLAELPDTRHALVIGNAFGWSTLALAMAAPRARVVAVDANVEGDDVQEGKALTLDIAADEQLDVQVIDGLSPRDIPCIVETHLDGRLDFVLIDGLHYSPQLIKDFEATLAYAAPGCVFFMHDVLNWHMLAAVDHIRGLSRVHAVRLLDRLPSGVGVALLEPPAPGVATLIDTLCDDTHDLESFWRALGAEHDKAGALTARLARGYPLAPVFSAIIDSIDVAPEQRLSHLLHAATQVGDHAEAVYTAACHLLDHGQPSQAEPLFQKAARLAPQWAEPPHQLGRIARQQGRTASADDYFELAATLAPSWAPPLFERALLAWEGGRQAEAHALFERVAELAPAWRETHMAQVQFLLQHAGFTEALERCIQFQSAMPETRLAEWDLLEPALLASVTLAPLALALDEACRREPSIKVLWKLLGLARRQAGDIAGSIAALQRAVELAPQWPSALTELGRSYCLAGQSGEARSCYERALAARPGFPDAAQELVALASQPAAQAR